MLLFPFPDAVFTSSRWISLASASLPRRPGQHLRLSAPASNIFPMALCHSAAILVAMALPACSSAAALRLAAVPRTTSSIICHPTLPPLASNSIIQHPTPAHTARQQPHHPSDTCTTARRQPHPAEIRRWRRQSVQMGRQICYV